MRAFLKNNSLSIAMFGFFLLFLTGQYAAGWLDHNQDNIEHGRTLTPIASYVADGHFLEAVFENWESEFLQMAAFVFLTVFLFQKGSAESKDPEKKEERVDKILAESRKDPKMPWPVRRGGWVLSLYNHSLSLALFLLFVISFVLHAIGGASQFSAERVEHGQPPAGVLEYVSSPKFWFESFQNWQSEFLSIGVMVVFTIFLRQKGSPESKPVDTPHSESGSA